jgi:hypothetical protein
MNRPMTPDELSDALAPLAHAVRLISYGDGTPAGLEGLSLAIAGRGLENNLADSITDAGRAISENGDSLADAVRSAGLCIAEAVEHLAEAVQALADRGAP